MFADPATPRHPSVTKRSAAASVEEVEGAEGTISRGGGVDERTDEKSESVQLKGRACQSVGGVERSFTAGCVLRCQ